MDSHDRHSHNHRHSSSNRNSQHFVPPPQAYTTPPPVNNQQQLSPYHPYDAAGAAANTSLAPWTAPPVTPHRGDSYRSQRSHHSRQFAHSDDGAKRHREKRPTIGDSLFALWGFVWGAVRSPSGKRG